LVFHHISIRRLAEGWWLCAKSIADEVIRGDKALGPERLEELPDQIAEDFVEEFVRQRWGKQAGVHVLARVNGKLAQGDDR